MRRTRRLKKLSRCVEERVDQLSALLQPHVGSTTPAAARIVAHASIECVSAWGLFAREYYLSCALLDPELKSGQTVTYPGLQFKDERTAMIAAIRATKNPAFAPGPAVKLKPRDEPDWLSKVTLSKISTKIGFSHDVKVTNALSVQATFFSQGITTRNFFAHRAKESADKVRNAAAQSYNGTVVKHPVEFVNVILPGKTDTLLNEWLAEIKIITAALT
jgi:hypothetical protein